jgi:hypothetical protein
MVQSAEGVWYLYLKAEDNAGNTTTEKFGPYRHDITPPVINLNLQDEYLYPGDVVLDFSAEDELSDVEVVSASFDGMEYSPGETVVFSRPGIFDVVITAMDNAGNSVRLTRQINILAAALVTVDPGVINLKSDRNGIVTIYLELPEGLDITAIQLDSIKLNGQAMPINDPKLGYVKNPVADYDQDGKLEYMLKFNLADIKQALVDSNGVITITGDTGAYGFMGTTTAETKE